MRENIIRKTNGPGADQKRFKKRKKKKKNRPRRKRHLEANKVSNKTMQQSQWPKAQSRVTKQLHTNSQTRLQKKLCRGPEMEGNRLPSHADHYWPSRVPGHQSKSKVTDCSLYLGTESTSEKTCTSNLRRPQRSEREESHCPEPTRLVWSHYFAVPTGMAWHGINALKSSQQRTTRRKAVALSKHLPGLTSERTTTLKFL